MAAHQAPPSLGFSRQEYWSGLPFSSPMHQSEKSKWSRSVVSDSVRPHRWQPTRLPRPWDSPWQGIKPAPPAIEAQTLNHWTTREVLNSLFKVVKKEAVDLLSNKKSGTIFFYYSPIILSMFIPFVFPSHQTSHGTEGIANGQRPRILHGRIWDSYSSQARKISEELGDQMSVVCVSNIHFLLYWQKTNFYFEFNERWWFI